MVSVFSHVSELLLYADELVILSHAVCAAERASLYLSAVGSYSDVGDGCVLCLARAVGGDSGVAVAVRHLDGIESLAE